MQSVAKQTLQKRYDWRSSVADVEAPSTAIIYPDGRLADAVGQILGTGRTRTLLFQLHVGDDPWDGTGLKAIAPAVTIHLFEVGAGADLEGCAATVVHPDLTVCVTV